MQASTNHGGQRERNDRRSSKLSNTEHWDRLSTAQRFAYYTLSKLGYQLLFVRRQGDLSLAITRLGVDVATIDNWGEVDFTPRISLRQ